MLQRAQLERELDVSPARARILLTDDPEMAAPEELADAYEGYVQAGTCESPSDNLKVDLASDEDDEVTPYLAEEGEKPRSPTTDRRSCRATGSPRPTRTWSFSLALTESGR